MTDRKIIMTAFAPLVGLVVSTTLFSEHGRSNGVDGFTFDLIAYFTALGWITTALMIWKLPIGVFKIDGILGIGAAILTTVGITCLSASLSGIIYLYVNALVTESSPTGIPYNLILILGAFFTFAVMRLPLNLAFMVGATLIMRRFLRRTKYALKSN
ncbi:MAG: hypothetical protein ACPG5U_10310 [Planktomarina sp.]